MLTWLLARRPPGPRRAPRTVSGDGLGPRVLPPGPGFLVLAAGSVRFCSFWKDRVASLTFSRYVWLY